MKDIVKKRKDIVFYIKLFPLAIHPGSKEKAQEIQCTHSLKLLEDSLEGKPIPKPGCKAPEIDRNIALGKKLGITGTPTIILPDGEMEVGALPEPALLSRIDQAVKQLKK
jgi:thiol:disulfide interchange protein DsbC